MNAPTGHNDFMSKTRQRGPGHESQLFDDTSQGPPPMYGTGNMPPQQQGNYMQPGANFPGSGFLNDPMVANMAMQYGQSLAGQGKEMFEKNVDKYISTSKLKYYFAVDTNYVGKKLALLCFPFTHKVCNSVLMGVASLPNANYQLFCFQDVDFPKEWSVSYHQDSPVAPRFDVNAPDLYIPVMAYVTYILISGISLGLVDKFTPEELGMQASSALVWLAIEVAITMFSLYLVNARTDLSTWDVIAYAGYKYVGMILIVSFGLLFRSFGYWLSLAYTSFTITYFLLKTLRLKILPNSSTDGFGQGGTRRMYLTILIAAMQPLFMFWLTRHMPGNSAIED